MEFYNSLIADTNSLLNGGKVFKYQKEKCCRIGEKGVMIFSKNTALELGGSPLPAVSMTLFCSDDEITDEVVLIGKDIPQMTADSPYARIAIVSLDEKSLPGEDEVYKTLKDIEFTKYHFYPEGCMLRLSPENKREQLRISKKAMAEGITLESIGYSFIDEYKKNAAVKAVKIVFVTEKDFEYKKLRALSEKAAKITESLNRIFDGLEVDCQSCILKPLCDEVEGMKDLHFGMNKNK